MGVVGGTGGILIRMQALEGGQSPPQPPPRSLLVFPPPPSPPTSADVTMALAYDFTTRTTR